MVSSLHHPLICCPVLSLYVFIHLVFSSFDLYLWTTRLCISCESETCLCFLQNQGEFPLAFYMQRINIPLVSFTRNLSLSLPSWTAVHSSPNMADSSNSPFRHGCSPVFAISRSRPVGRWSRTASRGRECLLQLPSCQRASVLSASLIQKVRTARLRFAGSLCTTLSADHLLLLFEIIISSTPGCGAKETDSQRPTRCNT